MGSMADVENPKPKRRKAKPKNVNQDIDESILSQAPSTATQLRVDQILQQVVAKSTQDAAESKKKKKKKSRSQEEDIVLESLRKGEGISGLHKDTDSAAIANTYDSDEFSKSEKSNKLRQKKR